jgi:hypothetical protein
MRRPASLALSQSAHFVPPADTRRVVCLHVLSSFQRTELFCPTLARWFAFRGTFQLYYPTSPLSTGKIHFREFPRDFFRFPSDSDAPPTLTSRRSSRDIPLGRWARRLSIFQGRRSCPGLTSVAYRYELVNRECVRERSFFSPVCNAQFLRQAGPGERAAGRPCDRPREPVPDGSNQRAWSQIRPSPDPASRPLAESCGSLRCSRQQGRHQR